jgi:hypothetical protein
VVLASSGLYIMGGVIALAIVLLWSLLRTEVRETALESERELAAGAAGADPGGGRPGAADATPPSAVPPRST